MIKPTPVQYAGQSVNWEKYIKNPYFGLKLAVYQNFLNFKSTLTKPGDYLDNIPLYNSLKFLRYGIYAFYGIEISKRVNFAILGSFFVFMGPKEGQIFIFDKCELYNF